MKGWSIMDIPKIFWKFFDLYRRKMITLVEYEELTGMDSKEIKTYLDFVAENQ